VTSVLLVLGFVISGVALAGASGLKRRDLFFRDALMFVFAPVLLFIAFVEFVVVPTKGA